MKMALILSLDESPWRSCQIIAPNLCQLYQKCFPEAQVEVFNYADQMGEYQYFCTIQELLEFFPDKIIICDHKPHPAKLIKDLMKKWQGELPPFYFHVFGDFSLYTVNWLDMEDYLKNMRIMFIAASHRQVNFIRQFIEDGEEFVSYLPFPINGEKYHFSPEHRAEVRAKFQWEEREEKNFLYTGRISAQKNVIPLIKSFNNFLEISGPCAHLYIAGSFDDLAFPFFGVYHPQEFNRYQFLKSVKELQDGPGKERIHFLGNLSSEELFDYYHACDIFVSLSLHNDEDYGVSPAEALCCGMPLILSDWGGYASFCLPETPSSLVKVELVDSFYRVDYIEFVKKLIKYNEREISCDERKELSRKGLEQFSINGNVERLREIHVRPTMTFSSWNKNFQKFSNCFHINGANPFGIVDFSTGEDEIKEGENRVRTKAIYRECYNEYVKDL